MIYHVVALCLLQVMMGSSMDQYGNTCLDSTCHEEKASAQSIKLNTGNSIPTLALGVYQIKPGNNTYFAVSEALRMGYRHIDTAALYQNEVDVGRAIRDSKIPRDSIFVTTKLWTLALSHVFPNPFKRDGYSFAMQEARESLERLGTYIDLYLLHSPHHPEHRLEMWRALEDLVASGDVKSIGVSNFGVHHVQEFIKNARIIPAVNQIEVHPFLRRREIVDICKENGIQIAAYSPLVKGKAFGHPLLVQLAQSYGRTQAQILIRWSIQNGFITLPKSQRRERIEANSHVFDFEISKVDMERLNELGDANHVSGWDPTVEP